MLRDLLSTWVFVIWKQNSGGWGGGGHLFADVRNENSPEVL